MSRAAMEAMGWPNGIVVFPESMQPNSDESGVIACTCRGVGCLIPPRLTQVDTIEPYDERESNP